MTRGETITGPALVVTSIGRVLLVADERRTFHAVIRVERGSR